VERANSTLAKTLAAYVDDNQTNWPKLLPSVMMAFRSTPATESTGFSPFQLVFGKEMLLPVDLDLLPKPSLPRHTKEFFDDLLSQLKISRDIAKKNMQTMKEKTKIRFDKNAKAPDFQVNDKVILRQNAVKPGLSHKLCPKWSDPYVITELGPNFTYKIKNCKTDKTHKPFVNASRLKHYQENIGPDLDVQEQTAMNDPQAESNYELPAHSNEQTQHTSTQSDVNSQSVEANGPRPIHPKSVESSCPQSANPLPNEQQKQPQSINENPKISNSESVNKFIRPKRIFKVCRYKGERWFRCYIEGCKFSKWYRECDIDPDFLCEYWESYTKSGRRRKRKDKSLVFWRKTPEE
jgi:hypothetical protein